MNAIVTIGNYRYTETTEIYDIAGGTLVGLVLGICESLKGTSAARMIFRVNRNHRRVVISISKIRGFKFFEGVPLVFSKSFAAAIQA